MPSEPTVEEVENLLDGIQHWGNIDDSLIPAKTRSTLIAICRHFLASPMTAGEFAGLVIQLLDKRHSAERDLIALFDEGTEERVKYLGRAALVSSFLVEIEDLAAEHNITIVEPKK